MENGGYALHAPRFSRDDAGGRTVGQARHFLFAAHHIARTRRAKGGHRLGPDIGGGLGAAGRNHPVQRIG